MNNADDMARFNDVFVAINDARNAKNLRKLNKSEFDTLFTSWLMHELFGDGDRSCEEFEEIIDNADGSSEVELS